MILQRDLSAHWINYRNTFCNASEDIYIDTILIQKIHQR